MRTYYIYYCVLILNFVLRKEKRVWDGVCVEGLSIWTHCFYERSWFRYSSNAEAPCQMWHSRYGWDGVFDDLLNHRRQWSAPGTLSTSPCWPPWCSPCFLIHIGVPFGLDGVWHLYFVSGIFSAITSIIIVRRAKITGNPRRLKKANGNWWKERQPGCISSAVFWLLHFFPFHTLTITEAVGELAQGRPLHLGTVEALDFPIFILHRVSNLFPTGGQEVAVHEVFVE